MGLLLTSGAFNETHRTRMPQPLHKPHHSAVFLPSSHPTATLVTDRPLPPGEGSQQQLLGPKVWTASRRMPQWEVRPLTADLAAPPPSSSPSHTPCQDRASNSSQPGHLPRPLLCAILKT